MLHESILTEVTVTGITVYGLALLFIKALLIVVLAQLFSDSFELSPAAIRHTVWLIALASLAALPVLTLLLPAWGLMSVDVRVSGAADMAQGPIDTVVLSSLSWLDGLVIVYAVVAVCRLAYLSFEVLKVGWLTANATTVGSEWNQQVEHYYKGRVAIKNSAKLESPVTWGTLYPLILLPENCEQWPLHERQMVLRHELGHIQRADWLAQLLGQLVAVLYWPVPGVGRALRSLSLEAERACDDLVLADGAAPADYASLLLRQARVNTLSATVALGKPSELAQRIGHIINCYVDRAGERKTRLWLAVSACLFLLPFASVQAIGHLPKAGFLSTQLIPIVMKPSYKQAPAPAPQPDYINKPSRPLLVSKPPSARLFAGATSPPIQPKKISSYQVTVSSVAELQQPKLFTSKVRVKIRQKPEYPLAAQRRGIEGRVLVEFDIDPQGSVANSKIIHSEGSGVFNRSVLNAINSYQFEPYRLGNEAIGIQGLKEEFRFKLIHDKPSKKISSGDSRAGNKPLINSS